MGARSVSGSVFNRLADAYDTAIVGTGREAEFLLLVSFLAAFSFIRTSAHLIRAQVRWWPGNLEVRGTHVHHMVWGILMLIVLGYAGIAFAPGPPWRELIAVGFGIAIGLTLDEFALWVELRDVYWLPQGRKSIDAVIVAATAGVLLLLGVRIWVELGERTAALVELVVTGSAAVGVVVAVVNALRGRYVAAAISLPIPLAGIALCAVLRPRPHSIWGRLAAERRARHARVEPTHQPSPP